MRLHRLSVTAFGPFVDTADVDFDALSGAGLFLLSGATGAGKSSVLDAVCFALYGAVPGDRQQAGRLRCDQAPPTLAPSVMLELSLDARRLRIVRSPAWRRPKKRGEGTTPEQARVAVSERVAGEWVHLTSRLDEAGDLLSGMLGMNLDQFCQVALLPQGHVQAFLRAKPDERQRLLARLFRTGRFQRVEIWLREHRLTLRRASDAHAGRLGDLVSRLSEASGSPLPDTVADLTTAQVADVAAWSGEVRESARERRTTSDAAAELAASAQAEAQHSWESVQGLAEARTRIVLAAEVVERLEADAGARAEDQARAERARRAESTRPLARLVVERAAAGAEAEARATSSRVAAEDAGLDVADLESEQARLTDEVATLSALLPAESELSALRDRAAEHEAAATSLRTEQDLADAESASVQAQVLVLRDQLERAAEADRALGPADAELRRWAEIVGAHDEANALAADHAAASDAHAAARAEVSDRREHLLDLRERRIAGVAAELAGGLVVGADCPVCGSADHPHPASSTVPRPDADAERTAQRALDDAQAVELALQLRVRELDASLSRTREVIGGSDPVAARAALSGAEAEVSRLRAMAGSHDVLRTRVETAEARVEELRRASAERALRVTEVATAHAHVLAQAVTLELRVAAARGEHHELRDALAVLTSRRDLARAVGADARAADVARTAHADAATALQRAVLEAGFASNAEAEAAALPPADVAALERAVHEHRTTLASAHAVLEEPDAWELLTTPEPDLAGAEERARAADAAYEAARTGADEARRTHDRVCRLGERLDAALADWAPVRDQLALASRVSAFAEGKAADNRLQMRLSAFVLAFRLSQVVAAANVRLATMSDRRYSLEHVPERGARETRGGLSLVVRDDWSGDTRDPATLSGGETFVVSLALALGLADVVAHEAGGADLQTLFVDEGFGALDSETLDDVLDILDTLRESGRAVGVVSHVAEMRDRIPAQLLVRKARSGSTLHVVEGGG